MRTLRKQPTVSRRGFLRGGGLAAIGVTVTPAALAQPPREAMTAPFRALGPATARTLVAMSRDIFPHDKLSDRYYVDAIAPLEKSAAGDKATRALLQQGVAALDASARERFGRPYGELAREGDRVALLQAIETTPFFQKVRGELVTGLYNNKAVWPLLGYEGSSWEKGGYLHRGFDDIDWL
ncbi:Twin-arginine translocation pathway signal [Cupriavidus sp. USMAA2-4]|uniref:Twin-arginine translocation pathway signal n=2 Tax=Cupriavidus TaxID=106589 RepID=A0ABN4TYT9_9BURK|nr:Twin-arginine translocation pathway signal [Cupriavidus sp. USMAA2-4]AOZ10890.1 Twin-arginine translocation pathway signal [Cupriavidus malaysiensis]